MKKIFSTMLIALLGVVALAAQDRVQKVVTIKNGNRNGILHTLQELAPTNGMVISTSDNDHLILSGPKETVAGFEAIITQLDVAPPAQNNVETNVYMIIASAHPNPANPVPGELEPVVTQLKGLFNYKGFHLLDSFVLRSRSGERGDNDGFVQPASPASGGAKIVYHFQFNRVRVSDQEKPRVVRFDGLRLSVNVPLGLDTKGEVRWGSAGVQTDVDVPEGKKVVIGKTSGLEGSDSALILVVSAKVVD